MYRIVVLIHTDEQNSTRDSQAIDIADVWPNSKIASFISVRTPLHLFEICTAGVKSIVT
jgi:hypothetical protein